MTDLQMLSGLTKTAAKDVQKVRPKLHVSEAVYCDQVTITECDSVSQSGKEFKVVGAS